jgi:hypothetical protein
LDQTRRITHGKIGTTEAKEAGQTEGQRATQEKTTRSPAANDDVDGRQNASRRHRIDQGLHDQSRTADPQPNPPPELGT